MKMKRKVDSGRVNGDKSNVSSPPSPLQETGYGSTRAIFQEIHDFLALLPGLEADSVRKLAYFAFAVLFPECAPILPLVWVVSPDAAAATRLLRMLQWVLAQSLRVSEVTPAGLAALSTSPCQVLLVDAVTLTRGLLRTLRLACRPGTGVIRKGEIRGVSCPAVVCTAEPLGDPQLLDFAIQVPLIPTRSGLPRFDAQLMEESSQGIRTMLFEYREANLAKVHASEFDASGLSYPIREIAALLGRSIVEDPELQAGVIPLLRAQDIDARTRRADSLLAVVTEAGLFLCHEPQRTEARVGEFTTIANGILKGRGETIELKPRPVGDLLRSLQLFPERLGAAGRGIRFQNEVRLKIHQLAIGFNVRSLLDQVDRCGFCKEARARFGDAQEQAS